MGNSGGYSRNNADEPEATRAVIKQSRSQTVVERFKLNAKQTSIPEEQWSRELISLAQLGQLESADYHTVVETLQ